MQPADYELRRDARSRMQESQLVLDAAQRNIVNETIVQHCRMRDWHLFAVNCRSNHVHVVVRCNRHPDIALGQFKSWSTRRLKEIDSADVRRRKRWWSEGGSCRIVNDEAGLDAAIAYVRDAQDWPSRSDTSP
jgi:REP element-mobilizing transposase RayT